MPKLFIAGCGYLGLTTARLMRALGWEVIASTLSRESAESLKGEDFQVITLDIANRQEVESHPYLRRMDAVLHCASSNRGGEEAYRRVYLQGIRHLAEIVQPKELIFTSSTSVYAQTDGALVSERCAAEPVRETGRILREAEDVALEFGGAVARVAGLYGPGRAVLLRKFFAGEAVLEAGGNRWINQIHCADAASAMAHLLERTARGIYNVTDNHPMTQNEVYEWLTARFGRPFPPEAPADLDRKRGWTNKRVSNAKLRAFDWVPRYPSFRDAVLHDQDLLSGIAISPG